MIFQLHHSGQAIHSAIRIPGSKSESNRLLILQKFFPSIHIENLSNSDDTRALQKALESHQTTIDIGHAGTAMRFLTAYYAFSKGEKILTGSSRMQQRPIKILVGALNTLGAQIEYLKNEGYPPLKITGGLPTQSKVSLKANVSSQFISALLLAGTAFPKGLSVTLEGEILSKPYIEMTLQLLQQVGIKTEFSNQTICVYPTQEIQNQTIEVESDWSSASYFYSMAALAQTCTLKLSTYKSNSLQGDAYTAKLYQQLGVETTFKNQQIILKKSTDFQLPKYFEADLIDYPDLAQTLAVTCSGMGIDFKLNGLNNLRIKETDRLQALQNELNKLGMDIKIQGNSLMGKAACLKSGVTIKTYEDHRMAMAFAPLALKKDIHIENPEVVTKSFPGFWKAMEACGLSIKKQNL